MAGDPGYSVAKGGAIAFVRSMAPRLAAEGTTISAICPGFADTAIIDPIREEFDKAGFPVLTAEEVADAMVLAWTSGEPGAAYVIQPGIGTIPYTFKGVPSAKTASRGDRRRPGGAAPAVDALTSRAECADDPREPLDTGAAAHRPCPARWLMKHEIRSEIDIEAPPDAVWAQLSDLGSYRNGTRSSRGRRGRRRLVSGCRCGCNRPGAVR